VGLAPEVVEVWSETRARVLEKEVLGEISLENAKRETFPLGRGQVNWQESPST